MSDEDAMSEIQATVIEEAMGEQRIPSRFHDRAPEYGLRCWRIRGELFDVVYWDCGNGWAWVQQVICSAPPEDIIALFVPGKDYGTVYRELGRFFNRLASEVSPRGSCHGGDGG